jgi:hypothetical protein
MANTASRMSPCSMRPDAFGSSPLLPRQAFAWRLLFPVRPDVAISPPILSGAA